MYHCNWYVCTDAHLFFEPSCVLLGCTETEPKLYLAHYPHMCSTAHVQCQDFTQEKSSSLQVYWSRANYDSSTHYWQEKVNCHSLTLIFTFFSVSWNTYHAWCQSFPTFFLFYQVFLKHNQWWIRYSTSSRTNFDWLHQEMNRIYERSLWDCHFQNAQTPWWERLICTFINWQSKKNQCSERRTNLKK